MKIRTVKSEGLAHNSYYFSDEGEAVVIDPRRDCEIYRDLAQKECATIKYILETHRNEDYVVGSLELQNMSEAEIGHSNALPFKYGEHNLVDNEILHVGGLTIKVLHTPGHTNESLSFVVAQSPSSQPMMVFTGDTLFAGSVGRTDLNGKEKQTKQAEKLYESLREKLLPLGDGVLVYPGHGAGSVCGHGISGQEPTTIGYEKKNNPYLNISKEQFLQKSASEELVVPRYFRKMEAYNLEGPPLLSELSYPKALSLETFEEEMQEQKVLVIDTRMPYSFAGAHIPKSLNIWLGGTGVYPGWLLDTDQYVIFVHERRNDIDTAAPRMRRLGFDNMCGYLCEGMNQWQEAGKLIASTRTMSVVGLKSKLERQELTLLDVREPSEWKEEGIIEGARPIFFADLSTQTGLFPKDKPTAVICSVGNRASIAASILEISGFKEVSNVLGGMTAWARLDYPTKYMV